MPSINDYIALITSEHAARPRFRAVIAALVKPYVELQQTLDAILPAFNLDQAVGDQLDMIGLWVGVKRQVLTPLADVYFTLDDNKLGFDFGSWQGRFDPDRGLQRLDDDTFRLLIHARILANHWDGSANQSSTIFSQLFHGETAVFIQDHQDMSIDLCISGQPPSAVLLALMIGGYLPLKPAGVRMETVIVSTKPGPLFGFDIDNKYIQGFEHGAWGQLLNASD